MKLKMNKKIMKIVDDLYNGPKNDAPEDISKYNSTIKTILDDTVLNNINKEKILKEKEKEKESYGKFKNVNYAF